MKKRGQLDYVLTHVLGLIIAIIIALALLIIAVTVYNMFFRANDKATENNFDRLVESIDKMINYNFKVITVPYYMKGAASDKYVLFGFSKNDMYIKQTCGGLNNDYERPLERCPIDSSCLCLYNYDQKKYLKCYSNYTIDSFTVDSQYPLSPPASGSKLEEGDGYYLSIFGKCGTIIPKYWKVRNIKIEKTKTPEGTYKITFMEPNGEETVREEIPIKEEPEQEATQAENQEQETLTYTSLSGLLELPLDCSDDGFPSQSYIDKFNSAAYNSGGKTRGQLMLEVGTESGVHPAIMAAAAQKESQMGDAACYHGGKSSLTGCNWPTTCAPGCSCDYDDVWSDELQIRCTANTYKTAFMAASTGSTGSTYTPCSKYNSDPMLMWNCIICTYVHGFQDETSCGYADNLKEFYCQWYNYLQSQVGTSVAQEKAEECKTKNSFFDYVPIKSGSIERTIPEGEGIQMFAKENLPVYLVKQGTIKSIGCDGNLGNTIVVLGDNNDYYYYYHLNSYSSEIAVGMNLPGGTLLGYTGTTLGCFNEKGVEGKTYSGISLAIYRDANINDPADPTSYLTECMSLA